MARDTTPAIARTYTDADRDATVRSTPYDGVTHSRGWGDSGYRVEVVEFDCPANHCHFDRMVRRVDVSPETPTEVRYWCLNPNCRHFVSDTVSHACHGSYPQLTAREPVVFESDEGV